MTEADFSVPNPVDPNRLRAAITSDGWELVGQRPGFYERFRQDSGVSVLIPLDQSAADLTDLMAAALKTIRSHDKDGWTRRIEPLLHVVVHDTIRFRKETGSPKGLISWKDGETLIESARLTLSAGAKAYLEPSRHFVNRFGQFARRYLDQVMMGQSGAGSYVVTALSPSQAQIPFRQTSSATLGLAGGDIALARDLTSTTINALEAIDHYRSSGSLSGFDNGVASGVSHEMTIALREMVARVCTGCGSLCGGSSVGGGRVAATFGLRALSACAGVV